MLRQFYLVVLGLKTKTGKDHLHMAWPRNKKCLFNKYDYRPNRLAVNMS